MTPSTEKLSWQTRYDQSFSGKQQSQQQNIQRALLNSSNPTPNFRMNQNKIPPPEWFEQTHLLPKSLVNGRRVLDSYALTCRGSQFAFLLDTISSFLELPKDKHQQLFSNSALNMKCLCQFVMMTLFDKIN